MSITQSVITVGTATQTVVAPTNDFVRYTLKNLQPANPDELARDGYIYLVSQQFSIASGSSVSFSIMTGETGAQFDFYEIIAENSTVKADLIEGATIVTTGSPFTAYNLNRNYADTHNAVLKAATSVTGGTSISGEFVTATNQGGGAIASSKVHTLKPNTEYAMKFANVGNQTTNVYFQLGFSEHYNGYNTIWLGTANDSYALRAGEELKMELTPNATINAVALANNKLAVMRQA